MKSFMLSMMLLLPLSAFAQRAKKIELVNFVKEAKAFAEKSGFEAACKEFNDGTKFKRGEFYIFAYDYKGVVLCHGGKKALIGKNLMGFKDKNGNELIKKLVAAAESGEGFVRYVWPHPKEKILKRKLGYALPIDKKYWIGSGIYYEKK